MNEQMTKKVLEIEDFEDKKTQNGKSYVRFKTSEGWLSCFDNKSSIELKKLCGQSANVEIIQSGEFQNIKKFLSAASEKPEEEATKPGETAAGKTGKNKEMYVSYAKDCFCAIASRISQSEFDGMDEEQRLELADLAIKVVKRIESSFS